jgi:endonuclease/exonuclease/phosphatase family metal-dependent hydrolase
VRLRVGSWNLHNGGLNDGDDTRLRQQVAVLAGQELDLVGLQEAKWGPRTGRLLHDVAHQLGMSGRFWVPSNHHGCDLVMLVRERAGLRVVEERHDTSGSWWHALGNLRLVVAGVGYVEFLNTHLAPSSAGRREAEAESFGLFKSRPTIAVGDFNARAASHDDPDDRGVDVAHAAAKLDRRAAKAMAAAGFVDVAADLAGGGDRTPTVGHTGADRLAYRCDRILYANLPVSQLEYEVIPAVAPAGTDQERVLSDHHLVVAALHLGGGSGGGLSLR